MKRNNKGFTLIELLAVIVILGILMIVAIPMVTQYIESARKDTYSDTAKSYVSAAKYSLLNGQYKIATAVTADKKTYTAGDSICAIEDTPYIPLDQIDVDNTGGKSSFGGSFGTDQLKTSYVKVNKDATTGAYTYSICMHDSKGAGTSKAADSNAAFIAESELSGSNIKKSGATLCTAPTMSSTVKVCVKG